MLGGTYTPHCAAIHPARLVRGLAEACGAPGVCVYERTPVLGDRAGPGGHAAGTVRARYVIAGDRGLHAGPARLAPGGRAGVLADGRDRAAACGGVGRDRAGRPADVRRPAAPDHLRPADGRRPARLRRARARPTTSARRCGRRTTGSRPCSRRCGGRWPSCSLCCATSRSPTLGRPDRHRQGLVRVGRAGPADRIGWAGGYVGDGLSTTNLAGRTLADLITGATASSPGCRGSGTGRRTGSPSRCAGWVSTPGCRSWASRTGRRPGPGARRGWRRFMGRFLGE